MKRKRNDRLRRGYTFAHFLLAIGGDGRWHSSVFSWRFHRTVPRKSQTLDGEKCGDDAYPEKADLHLTLEATEERDELRTTHRT